MAKNKSIFIIYSPDDKAVLCGLSTGDIIEIAFDTEPSYKIVVLGLLDSKTAIIAPSGRYGAVVGNEVVIWDLIRRKRVASYAVKDIQQIAFSLTDQLLFCGRNGLVHLWNSEKNQYAEVFIPLMRNTLAAALSPNGEYIAGSLDAGAFGIWNSKTGKIRQGSVGYNNEDGEACDHMLQFSSNNQYFFQIASGDCFIRKALSIGCVQFLCNRKAPFFSLALSSDSRILAIGLEQGSLMIWKLCDKSILKDLSRKQVLLLLIMNHDRRIVYEALHSSDKEMYNSLPNWMRFFLMSTRLKSS